MLKYLDKFLKKVYQALIKSKEKVAATDLNLLLTFDLRKAISFLEKPNTLAYNLIYLGGKAYNLIQLHKISNLTVKIPFGFVLTTEVFRAYKLFKKYNELWKEYEELMREAVKKIEEKSGQKFNDPAKPLLLSVRSGATISMPGMMNSLLNVGLNLEITQGIAERTKKFMVCLGYL